MLYLIVFKLYLSYNPGQNTIATFEFSGFFENEIENVTLVCPLLSQFNVGYVAEYLGDLQERNRLLQT